MSYHLEPVISILARLLARDAVDAAALAVRDGRLVDASDGVFERLVHFPVEDRVADTVSQVEGADEEDVDAWYGCDCVYLLVGVVRG